MSAAPVAAALGPGPRSAAELKLVQGSLREYARVVCAL